MEQGLQRKGPGDGKAWLAPLSGVEWGGPTSGTCGFAASLGWTQGLGSQNWKDRVLLGGPQYYPRLPASCPSPDPESPTSFFTIPSPLPVFPRRN